MRRFAIAADRITLDAYDRVKRRLNISDEAAHRVLERVHRLRSRLSRSRKPDPGQG
jgi:hypothetical protein